MNSSLYAIRTYEPDDKPFIMATFLRGLYYGDSWFSIIPKHIFMQSYKSVIEALLIKRLVMIACLKEDPRIIVGYAIISDNDRVIDWVFVKSVFRKQGIARALLPKEPDTVTHLSKLGLNLLKKFPKQVIFNPFAIGD